LIEKLRVVLIKEQKVKTFGNTLLSKTKRMDFVDNRKSTARGFTVCAVQPNKRGFGTTSPAYIADL
jgi:hypothetical protein